jgi:hypothetical protein
MDERTLVRHIVLTFAGRHAIVTVRNERESTDS